MRSGKKEERLIMLCYLLEDEENLNTLLSFSLKQEGYEVKIFFTYKDGFACRDDSVDAWIVDINLPDGSGLDLVKYLKERNHEQRVIIISARDSEIDKLIGLEIGSDDYITKPFLPRELNIRLGRLLGSVKKNDHRTFGSLSIDYEKRLVYKNQKVIDLTSKEYDMIAMFATHQNQAFSREQILENVWDGDYFGTDRVVDDLIRRIRKKIVDIPIETVYGFGYRWCGYEE
jgi:two-component system response regulator CssR